jgi:hypothetical protein
VLNCSTTSSSSIKLNYPEDFWSPKDSSKAFHAAGEIEVSAKIEKTSWQEKSGGIWEGRLSAFQIKYERIDSANKKIERGPFTRSGFASVNNEYVMSIIIGDEGKTGLLPDNDANKHDKPLTVYVSNFQNRPDSLEFNQKITVGEVRNYKHSVEIRKENFKINGQKPRDMNFNCEAKLCVNLIFVESPAPSPKTEPPSDSQLPSWISKNFGVLELEYSDKNEDIKGNDKWEYPYSEKNIHVKDYTHIRLVTPSGIIQCGKLSKDTASIWDFNRKIKVKVAKPSNLILYLCKDEKTCFPVFIKEITPEYEQDFIEIDIPKAATMKLLVIKKGKQHYEKRIKPEDTEINMMFSQQTFRIKTDPAEALVTVKTKNGYVLFTGISNNDGSLSVELPADEEKIIRVEKEGYVSEEQDLSDSQWTLDIKLEPVKQLSFIDFENYEGILKIFAKNDIGSMEIEIKNDDGIIFKGSLRNIAFIPEGATHFQLYAEDYSFKENKISPGKKKITINELLPSYKAIHVALQLVDDKQNILRKKKTFLKGEQKYELVFNEKDARYHGEVYLPVSYNNEQNLIVKPGEVIVCTSGFTSSQITLPYDSSAALTRQRIPPKVIIVISGNRASTGMYYSEGMKAVTEIWEKVDKVFIAEEGKIIEIKEPQYFKSYMPAYDNTDVYIEKEIDQAKTYLSEKADICGNPIPSFLIYIAQIRRFLDKSQKLHIISPDDAPSDWKGHWHKASDSKRIEQVLTKILNES